MTNYRLTLFLLIAIFQLSCIDQKQKILFDKVHSFEELNKEENYSLLTGDYIVLLVLNPTECKECESSFKKLQVVEQKGIKIFPIIGDQNSDESNMRVNIEYMKYRTDNNIDARFLNDNEVIRKLYDQELGMRVLLLDTTEEKIKYDSYVDEKDWFEVVDKLDTKS